MIRINGILLIFMLYLMTQLAKAFLVKTEQGLLSGIEEKTLTGRKYLSYLGVPYAKPPINELRFKDPVTPEPWDGIFEAKTLPDYCIQNSVVQGNLGNNPLTGTEDCLYLNVYVPKGRTNLAVMVYIHGGAFYRGGAREYGPNTLLDEDVILIIPNYRVGAFGFLSTEDSVIPGNFGLKDQTMALEWIQKNVGHFGGNPNKVTIFGQSAGGASIHYLILSPWTEGLFRRAILQSGSALCPWAQSTNHRNFAGEIGQQFNCSLQEGSEIYLECLQQVDSLELLEYVSATVKWYISPNFNTPRVDGDFLPDNPETLLAQGRFRQMNILTGIVKDEGASSLPGFEKLLDNFDGLRETSLALDEEADKEELSERVYRRYFGNSRITRDQETEFVEMISDRYFMVCYELAANFFVASTRGDTYLYEFDYKPDASPFDLISELYKNWIVHAEELGLLFNGSGIFNRPMNDTEDLRMKRLLVQLWTNFAKTGNPTPDDSLGFIWPKSSTDRNYLHISSTPRMRKYSRQHATDWWLSLPLRQNKLLFPGNVVSKDEL